MAKTANKKISDAEVFVAELQGENIALLNENTDLQCKVQKITQAIASRFDADGVNDITLPTGKINIFFWVVSNFKVIYDLVKEIVEALKNPCNQVTEVHKFRTTITSI